MWAMALLLAGCAEPPPPLPPPAPRPAAPAPAPVGPPQLQLAPPTRETKSPVVVPADAELDAAVELLTWVVQTYGRDPGDPWAIGHALIALGPEIDVHTGARALPWLFETYAELRTVGGERLVGFPRSKGSIRVEPHTDLMLKAFLEVGVPLDATYVVGGAPVTLTDLYRHSLYKAWIDPKDGATSFDNLNDTAWSLQALSSAAPAGLEWTAKGGHPMSMDRFTDLVVADLDKQTQFMQQAMARGEKVEKQRQGIFAYTCGGHHLLQGAAHAVARGFGSPQSRAHIERQVEVLFWRYEVELEIYDRYLRENPDYGAILLNQRLKFLGHFLESAHKLAAYGFYTPDDAQRAKLAAARTELVRTVKMIDAAQLFKQLEQMKSDPNTYQLFLDFVGDSAHALRGVRLSTGEGVVRW